MRQVFLTMLLSWFPLFLAVAGNGKIDCDNAATQQDMTLCAQKGAEQSDVELEELLLLLTKKVSIAEQKQLEQEHQEWRQQRASHCVDETRRELDIGPSGSFPTLFPEVYASCMQRMSLERQKVLKDMLRLVECSGITALSE